MAVRLAQKIFPNTLFLSFRFDTRASIPESRKFFFAIENKIHFFLVDFATDF